MNPQERSLLENFLDQLVQVRSVNKDPEADRMIAQAVQQQPDSTYLLVQRALLLTQALDQAKARIATLEQAEPARGQGFLDASASGWANPPGQSPSGQSPSGPSFRGQPPTQYPGYGPPPSAYSPYAAPPAYPAPGAGGFSSFLGQAAATAAGVAGGEFLFQGIENLFGHHGGGFFPGEAPAPFPTEDVTINNYNYNSPDEVIVQNDNFDQSPPDDPDGGIYTSDDPADDEDFV
jgi:hypothetical protein